MIENGFYITLRPEILEHHPFSNQMPGYKNQHPSIPYTKPTPNTHRVVKKAEKILALKNLALSGSSCPRLNLLSYAPSAHPVHWPVQAMTHSPTEEHQNPLQSLFLHALLPHKIPKPIWFSYTSPPRPWRRPPPLVWHDSRDQQVLHYLCFSCSIWSGSWPAEGLRMRPHPQRFGPVVLCSVQSSWFTMSSCLSCLLFPAPSPLSFNTLNLYSCLQLLAFLSHAWAVILTILLNLISEPKWSFLHTCKLISSLDLHYFIGDSSLIYVTISLLTLSKNVDMSSSVIWIQFPRLT